MACRDRTGAFGGTVDPVTEPAPETPPMRIGNAEREEAAQLLAEHFSHGRLDVPLTEVGDAADGDTPGSMILM